MAKVRGGAGTRDAARWTGAPLARPGRCLASGGSFAPGEGWTDLNLAALRFQYSRNPPFTNATEYEGKTYRITAIGAVSGNYDLRYQQGTLTVVP